VSVSLKNAPDIYLMSGVDGAAIHLMLDFSIGRLGHNLSFRISLPLYCPRSYFGDFSITESRVSIHDICVNIYVKVSAFSS